MTALGLAAARAVESSRADRLVEDPFARPLFEASEAGLPMLTSWPEDETQVSDTQALHLHGSRYIGLRTRVYDDLLLDAVRAGIAQLALLGAGLDTRAFRLPLPPDLLLVEVDQAGVLAFKNQVLETLRVSPRCRRASVGADLRETWTKALPPVGFDSHRPTAWIAEGLLPYLPPDAQSRLLEQVTQHSPPGSTLAFDRVTGDTAASDRLRFLSERSGIAMTRLLAGGEPEDLPAKLAEHGWNVEEHRASELAARYDRDLADPFLARTPAVDTGEPPWLDTIFLIARREP